MDSQKMVDIVSVLDLEELQVLHNIVLDTYNIKLKSRNSQLMANFRLGQQVEFTVAGKLYRGTIVRFGSKNVGINVTSGGHSRHMRIPPSLIHEVIANELLEQAG